MAVEASIIVKFEGDEDRDTSSIIVEIDDIHGNNLDIEEKVKSSFSPEDVPVFRIHHPDDIEIVTVKCTDGSVDWIESNVGRDIVSSSLFTDEDSDVDVSHSNISISNTVWFGNTANLYVEDGGVIKISSGTTPCYGDITYRAVYQRMYSLSPPALELEEDETYTIYVVIYVRDIL